MALNGAPETALAMAMEDRACREDARGSTNAGCDREGVKEKAKALSAHREAQNRPEGGHADRSSLTLRQ